MPPDTNCCKDPRQRIGLVAVQLGIVDGRIDMKRILILSFFALLGGCVIVPLGYGHRGDGYYRGDGY
jgi:hypothetical protein